jgi:ribosomal protein S3AE
MAIAKKKKRFFTVEMPLIRKQTQLQAFEAKELSERFIKYDLTRILKGKSSIITFKTHFEDENLIAKPKEFKLMAYYLKRMVRRGTNYVEDSFEIEGKDSVVRLKPFLVTRRKVSRAVRKTLRNKAKEEIINWAKELTSEKMFEEILKNKIQKELSVKLKKIYPLSLCEIRVIKVERDLTKTQ